MSAHTISRKTYRKPGVFTWIGSSRNESGLLVAEAVQRIDFSNNITTSLDFIHTSTLTDFGTYDGAPSSTFSTDLRLNEVAYSCFESEVHPFGLVVGGGENGTVYVLDYFSFIKYGNSPSMMNEMKYDGGQVITVDVNLLDPRWVCSGGAHGVVLLWDLQRPSVPMSPGSTNLPCKCVRWCQQTNVILCALTNERCSVWDLTRCGAPVIEFAHFAGSLEWNTFCWSPVDCNCLITASQSDSNPSFMKWDLRFAASPVLCYQLHSKGIYAMDWCTHDSNFVISGGKDEQLIIHNPNTAQANGRIETKGWPRQIRWNPLNPNLFGVSYFDRPIDICSFTPFKADEPVEMKVACELWEIPAWMQTRFCGVSFAFGNKFSSFQRSESPGDAENFTVYIKQLELRCSVMEDIDKLHCAIENSEISSYCEQRAHSSDTTEDLWNFLAIYALYGRRLEYLKVLNVGGTRNYSIDEENLTILMQNMELENIGGSSSSEYEEYNLCNGNVYSPSFPPGYQLASKTEYLDAYSEGSPSQSISLAIKEKNWLFAILAAHALSSQSALRFVVEALLNDNTLSDDVKIMASIAADMWIPLVDTWQISHSKKLLSLLVAHAPASKIRSLCTRLALRLIEEDNRIEGALSAIISSNLSVFIDSVSTLSLDCILSGITFRYLIGQGSPRVVKTDAKYQQMIEKCAINLANSGFKDLAWKLAEPFTNEECSENLSKLRFELYMACGGKSLKTNEVPVNPYAAESKKYVHINQTMRPKYFKIDNGSMRAKLSAKQTYAPTVDSFTFDTAQHPFSNHLSPNALFLPLASPGDVAKYPAPTRASVSDVSNISVGHFLSSIASCRSDESCDAHERNKEKRTLENDISGLCELDKNFLNILLTTITKIRGQQVSPVVLHRIEDAEKRIYTELLPRLAKSVFIDRTHTLLMNLGECLAQNDFKSCTFLCSQMVSGCDFAELSSVIPALKSLINTSQQQFK